MITDQNKGMEYEYTLSTSENKIILKTKIKLNKNKFEPIEYESLRKFLVKIIDKEQEQIVLKRK